MKNGIVVKDHLGELLMINFHSVAFIEKTKTQGTAYFKDAELDKDAVLIRLNTWHAHQLWITDPDEMERTLTLFQAWIDGK